LSADADFNRPWAQKFQLMNSDPRPPLTAAPVEQTRTEFEQLLDSFRGSLDRRLQDWLAAKHAAVTEELPAALELTEVLSRFLMRGGKRLRPALIYYSYHACGASSEELVMPLAMAAELLHTYLLVHDDIMDRAALRRGEPAAHIVFQELHEERAWVGDPEHFGESVAILLGDLAQSYAQELYASVIGEAQSQKGVRRCFAQMCQEVIIGQYLEMTAGYRQGLSEPELLRVLQMKSGRYSVERPVQLGALLASAPAATLEALSRYGANVGEAFQLQDDLLGMFGDPATVGKPVGADLAEGKFTVLIHHAMQRLPPADAKALNQALGNAAVTPAEVAAIQALIEESGARERVGQMIEKRMEAGLAALASAELSGDGEVFLRGLVEYLRGREK
jgi:geranylgeranyl diphosphate synthase type I